MNTVADARLDAACPPTWAGSEARLRIRSARRGAAHLLAKYRARLEAGRHRDAGKVLNLILKSMDVRVAAVWEGNKRCCRGDRLPLDRLIDAAENLDVRQPTGELVRRSYVLKANGKLREVAIFGPLNRAAHLIIKWIAEPLITPQLLPNQFTRRGVNALTGAVAGALDHLGSRHAAELDITDFFPSVSVRWVLRRLGLPEALGVHIDAARLNGCPGIRRTTKGERRLGHLPRRGLAQGASVSPLLAEFVVSEVLRDAPWALATYADNILIVGKSREEVLLKVQALRAAFAKHPAGQFVLKSKSPRRLCDGFDFLGYRYRREWGSLVVLPSERNVLKLWSRLQRAAAIRWTAAAKKKVTHNVNAWKACFARSRRAGFIADHLAIAALRRERVPTRSVCGLVKRYARPFAGF